MDELSLDQRSQELQSAFEEILGSRNVYYNPPASVKMSYPAIVFSRSRIEKKNANNMAYMQSHKYEVTVIDGDPDCKYIAEILRLPMCTFDRHFVSDNLHHNTFTLYF
jgi:hypothetical protein